MMRSGSFESETEFAPRMRTRAPVPVVPPLWRIETPAARPVTSCENVWTGARLIVSTWRLATLFPVSRIRISSPVAVVTTPSSTATRCTSAKSTVVSWPSTIVAGFVWASKPSRRTRSWTSPAGIPAIR